VTAAHIEGAAVSVSSYANKGCRCDGCRTARRVYQQQSKGHTPRPDWQAFREDYEFLVQTGETHPEQIVARMHVPSIDAMEMRLRRVYGRWVPIGTLPQEAMA
jgi:hypothetical protein